MDVKKTGVLLFILCFATLLITAQVTFDPDPEEDVQLQVISLTPPVEITTVQCYSSSPTFKVQYVTDDCAVVYNIFLHDSGYGNGFPITGSTCGHSSQYRLRLDNLRFIADPVLVGGTFKLKVTINDNGENSTISTRTYTFPAPFNLSGSSVSALLNFPFTWTCHVTSDYLPIEWYKGISSLGQVGILDGRCVTFDIDDSYTYNCQQSALTYTLTIPASNMTEELQDSTWRCVAIGKELKGSKFVKLGIVVPVSTVKISPGSGSTLDVLESQTINFTCITNNANPLPTKMWFLGSSDVTSQAGSNGTTLTLDVTILYHQLSVKCEAWNSGNTAIPSDSTTLNVRSSAKFITDQRSNVVIGNHNVTLRGQRAFLNFTSVDSYHSGYYVLKIENGASLISGRGITLEVSAVPDPPANLTVQCKEGVAQLSWSYTDIYNSELSFHLLYKQEDDDAYTVLEKKFTNGGRDQVLYANIMNIKPKTVYHFKIASKNDNGLGEYTDTKTCAIFDNKIDTSSTGPSVGGVAGGLTAVFLVLIAVLIGVIIMRERRYRLEKGEASKGSKAIPMKYEDVQSSNYSNEQDVSVSEEHSQDERSTYEDLQNSGDDHTYDHV